MIAVQKIREIVPQLEKLANEADAIVIFVQTKDRLPVFQHIPTGVEITRLLSAVESWKIRTIMEGENV